jgi:small basic protein
MIFVPLLALFLGVVFALLWRHPITSVTAQYLAVACLAGLDTICGGIRSGLEGKFRSDVFFTGFLSNIVIAFFLAWLGDKIGIDLTLAVALVLGGRTFTNLSLIRRFVVSRMADARERRRLERLASQASVAAGVHDAGVGAG